METLNNLPRESTWGQLTFLPADSLASHTAKLDSEKELKMTATSGRNTLESLGKFSRVSLWGKMFMASLIGQKGWYSSKCRLTWKLLGMKSRRLYCRLVVSTLPTRETEFGLLHTPRAILGTFKLEMKDHSHKRFRKNDLMNLSLLPTPTAREGKGARHPETLKKSVDILAVTNKQLNNGHFNDVLEWFEYSAKTNKVEFRILEVWNQRLKKHLIEKRGFKEVKGTDHVIKKFL